MALDYNELCRTWDPWKSIPTFYNLGVGLTRDQVVRGHGDKYALHWQSASGGSRSLTYGELDLLTNRLASSLQGLGVRRGDRVFLRLPNRPEFYIAALAVAKLGAVFIPSSTQFREAEVLYRMNDSEAVAAITTSRLAEGIENVRGKCPGLQHAIMVDDGGALPDRWHDFASLVEQGQAGFSAACTRHD